MESLAHSSHAERLPPCMRASETPRLATEIVPSLGYAGIPVTQPAPAEDVEYWEVFVDWARKLLAAREAGMSW
jgi:hypothetical protein